MSYADEIRQKITSDLRARAREHDAGGLPFVAAVCRETADNIDRAVARATAEGLRRIGVAVAVWAGMAAAQEPLRDEVAIVRRWVEQWIRAERAALRAERAARRKWELRLRVRSLNKSSSVKARLERWTDLDRLLYREANRATVVDGPRLQLGHWLNIAGPRGVLP